MVGNASALDVSIELYSNMTFITFIFFFIYEVSFTSFQIMLLGESQGNFKELGGACIFSPFSFRLHDKLSRETEFQYLNIFYGKSLNLFLC